MGAPRWFFLILLLCLTCGSVHAERRVALVIGNSAYKSVPKLANPVNDAAMVGDMFKKAGFDLVEIKTDLNIAETRKVLREFGIRSRGAEIAVVYYAGHGIEVDGINYLVPTDAVLEVDTDVYDEALPLDRILATVEPATKLRLVILDACRDNPFAGTMKRTVASRSIGRGLAKIEPSSPNTMIAFAAKAGSTASDGDSKNSPFAIALVERLPKPGLDLRKAFGFVRDDVLKSTAYHQEPYVYGSLGGDDVPLVPAPAGPQADPLEAVRRDYEFALQLGTRDGWTVFLAQYPDGFYAGLAKGQLNKIAAEEARAAAADKARQAEAEKARLAADRANKAEQEQAAAAAKAAEDARLAAEKAKRIEESKAAEAEQRRKEAEAAVAKALAEKQAAEKALADRIAKEKAATELEAQKQAAATEAKDKNDSVKKVADVAPTPSRPSLSPLETIQLVQSELRRVGCLAGPADHDWGDASQRSLTLFNKFAGTKFDTKLASLEVLDAIKAKPGRICPIVCDHGFKADGDTCVKITCRPGYHINGDNECERGQDKKPVATRESPKPADDERKQVESAPPKPQARSSGQMICSSAGCRPVKPGCHVEQRKYFTTSVNAATEVCD